MCGLGLLIAFLVEAEDQEGESTILASSAILDILALIFNLIVFGILIWRNRREQQEQLKHIYEFATETKAETNSVNQRIESISQAMVCPTGDYGGRENPGYENYEDDSVFTPGSNGRVPGRSGSTTLTPNIGYQSGFPTPLSQANPNYVPVTGISTVTGSSHHTGSTINNESINTEPSLKNTSYISDSTAQRMGKSDQPNKKFPKRNDNPIMTHKYDSSQKLGQTASLPVDAAQVAPELMSDSDDSEVEGSYHPNESGAASLDRSRGAATSGAYADILVKDSTPNTKQGSANVLRHSTMKVNMNQLANESYVTIEGDVPKAYVFEKDLGPKKREHKSKN